MKDTKDIKTLADLTPDGENFNKHTEFGQKLLEDSLRKFGAGRSILVDKDGNIIAGNSTAETAAFVARLSKYGIPFEVSVGQSCAISSLDSQKDTKKVIYGKGYLISEKAAAEKAAAEKAAATRWTLSDRERAIIAKLSKNDSNGND